MNIDIVARELTAVARELIGFRLMGRLESILKPFGFTESRGKLFSETLGLSEYNKLRKQVAKSLQANGYTKAPKGPLPGTYFEHESGERILVQGNQMHRGWAFVIETA